MDDRVGRRHRYLGVDDCNPGYAAHQGQEVVVLRRVPAPSWVEEYVGRRWRVRADDGWEGTAFDDELGEL